MLKLIEREFIMKRVKKAIVFARSFNNSPVHFMMDVDDFRFESLDYVTVAKVDSLKGTYKTAKIAHTELGNFQVFKDWSALRVGH